MSDISYCNAEKNGKLCPLKYDCKRFTYHMSDINHEFMQSYVEACCMIKPSGVSCELFLPLRIENIEDYK